MSWIGRELKKKRLRWYFPVSISKSKIALAAINENNFFLKKTFDHLVGNAFKSQNNYTWNYITWEWRIIIIIIKRRCCLKLKNFLCVSPESYFREITRFVNALSTLKYRDDDTIFFLSYFKISFQLPYYNIL